MSNGVKQRFIELLEEDAAQAHKLLQAWTDLQKQGAELRDKDDKIVATAEEMVQKCIAKEKELWAFIEQVKAL